MSGSGLVREWKPYAKVMLSFLIIIFLKKDFFLLKQKMIFLTFQGQGLDFGVDNDLQYQYSFVGPLSMSKGWLKSKVN